MAHVSHITAVCYCQIRQLRLLRRSFSFEAAHARVRALVHSRLDYCNAVLANAPQMLVAPLQSVLRFAARVVLRCPRSAGLTQLICERLHCLSLPEKILFKLATLTYKCIIGRAPDYLFFSVNLRLQFSFNFRLITPSAQSSSVISSDDVASWPPLTSQRPTCSAKNVRLSAGSQRTRQLIKPLLWKLVEPSLPHVDVLPQLVLHPCSPFHAANYSLLWQNCRIDLLPVVMRSQIQCLKYFPTGWTLPSSYGFSARFRLHGALPR